MIKKETIEYLKFYLKDYLKIYHGIEQGGKAFTCLNPEHPDRNPSMFYTEKYNICKCFGCGVTYDIFNLIKIDYGITDFREQVEKVIELFEINEIKVENIKKKEAIEVNTAIDYNEYFDEVSQHKCDYLIKRNIDEKLIEKYKIGFDPKTNNVIFPITNNSFFARNIYSNRKYKSAGESYLWNEKLLNNSDEKTLIYVTESIIDALSIQTINPTLKTISLNGTTNYKRLIKLVEEKKFKGVFVIALDNDSTGRRYQKIIQDELKKMKIECFGHNLITNIDGVKDINEALVKDKKKLSETIKFVDDIIKQSIESYYKKNEKEGELIFYED